MAEDKDIVKSELDAMMMAFVVGAIVKRISDKFGLDKSEVSAAALEGIKNFKDFKDEII